MCVCLENDSHSDRIDKSRMNIQGARERERIELKKHRRRVDYVCRWVFFSYFQIHSFIGRSVGRYLYVHIPLRTVRNQTKNTTIVTGNQTNNRITKKTRQDNQRGQNRNYHCCWCLGKKPKTNQANIFSFFFGTNQSSSTITMLMTTIVQKLNLLLFVCLYF